MSFDLYVWHEPEPITAETAELRLEADVFTPHPGVPALHQALLARYPALDSPDLPDGDDGVWSMTPEPSDTMLSITISWSRAREVAAVVRALAAEHGLICYSPGEGIVAPNAPGFTPGFTLTTASGLPLPDPSPAQVIRATRKLNDDDYFAILERADGWYVQVGYGRTAGVAPGCYALEYREGTPDRHFRTETRDRTEAADFLTDFLAGDDHRRPRHVWQPLTL